MLQNSTTFIKYKVTYIVWDTDDEILDLPSELEVKVPDNITDSNEISDYLSDEISNITGFCHLGFNFSKM